VTRRAILGLAAALVIGCASDGGDEVPDACAGATGCNGACELGNDFGVGRFCTADGGECVGQAAAFCTVDFNEGADAFCTRPCDPDADVAAQCGADAICRTENGDGPAGCVPNICL
jgi:hypothetical protein